MSIKIYNAYRMDNMSVAELHNLLQYLKNTCRTELTKQVTKETARVSADLIDDCRIMTNQPDIGKILYDDFRQYLTELYKESRPGTETHSNTNEILKLLQEYKHLNVRNLMEAVTKRKTIAAAGITHDPDNQLVLFPYRNKILFQVFGNQITELMQTVLTNTEPYSVLKTFHSKYNIEDYHYQNQTDPPEHIGDKEWRQRKQDWCEVIPFGTPAQNGTVITFTDRNTIQLIPNNIDPTTTQRQIPPTSERIHQKAKLLVQTKAIQTYKDKTDISHILYLTSDSILSKHGKYYDEYLQFKSELKDCITDITPDDLQKQVTDFYSIDTPEN